MKHMRRMTPPHMRRMRSVRKKEELSTSFRQGSRKRYTSETGISRSRQDGYSNKAVESVIHHRQASLEARWLFFRGSRKHFTSQTGIFRHCRKRYTSKTGISRQDGHSISTYGPYVQ